jgi:hypothetical protein
MPRGIVTPPSHERTHLSPVWRVGIASLGFCATAVSCVSAARTPPECVSPPLDAPRGAIRRATRHDDALSGAGRAGIVVWVGGRVPSSGGLSEAYVRVVGLSDTLSFQTSRDGVGGPATLRPGVVTVTVRRLGYVRSRDTVVLRTGFMDTLGVSMWLSPNCLGQVRVGTI